MLSLHSANLASPNWPPTAWLIWSKGRCLAQSCSALPGNERSLRRNAAWLDLLRTAPSRSRTAQYCRPIQGEALVVCSMKTVQTAELYLSEPWKWSESEVLLLWNVKNCSDGGALSLWTMTMVRERSSVVLRHISHSESETLLRFNIKSDLSVVVLSQNRYAEITYVICQREWHEKRRDSKNMLKRWSRFRRN